MARFCEEGGRNVVYCSMVDCLLAVGTGSSLPLKRRVLYKIEAREFIKKPASLGSALESRFMVQVRAQNAPYILLRTGRSLCRS